MTPSSDVCRRKWYGRTVVRYNTNGKLDQLSIAPLHTPRSLTYQSLMDQPNIITAIGAISGTSMDGIDVSIVETDGDAVVRPGPGRTYPYAPELRKALLDLIAHPDVAEREPLSDLEAAVTDAHASAIAAFMRDFAVARERVALVGLHGQTVFHRPERRFTRQLGIGARVAKTLGIDVVNRFRHADVAAGGEGAPFAPLYHRALDAKLPRPVMVLNLGEIGRAHV